MKRAAITASALLVAVIVTTRAQSQGTTEATMDPAFRAFLTQFERGISQFINGDPSLWKNLASRADDVTLMGGWGTYERGWKQVGARYDWAAARFKDTQATVQVEYVSSGVSGDLAYTISVERSAVRVGDRRDAAPMVLRVTQLFRRESGAWRLIHRHADPLVDTTTAESVLKKQ
jgi:ketosteroid isomerase-like protein